MLRVRDFLKNSKLPILWTIGYVFMLWLVLHILFNFELFSGTNWVRVSHAHLHGLGGLAFCLIILAAIPLYIATITLVIRTKKPLLALPMPRIVSKILTKLFPKQMTIESETKEKNESEVPQVPTNEEQNQYPAEMRGAFIYARTHPNHINTPICSACSVNPNVYPCATPTEQNNEMPLPPDFDIDDEDVLKPTEPDTNLSNTPVFKEINFYDEPESQPDNIGNFDDTDTEYINPVIEHFGKTGRDFEVQQDDIIVTDNAAIAVHNDPDFWIMDEPTWFAAGKTRESPITKLKEIAQQNNVRAILYLGATNIMNFTEKRNEWEDSNVHVVTKLSDL